MKKTSLFAALFASVLMVGSLPVASIAEAQVYTAPNYLTGGCVNLTAPLTVGSSDIFTGGQVSQLQQFLVRVGLLSSVFATGYFGNDTAAAVARFQAAHAIPPVGVVGPLTRAAIAQVSCAGGTYPIIPPVNPVYPTYPTYPTYPGTTGIYLSSISPTSGVAGSVITLYGNNFAQWGNTVTFGTVSVSGLSSTGNSIIVTVPSLPTGTYQVSVSNVNGTTNSLQFTVTSNWPVCANNYNYNNQCGCPIYNNGSYYNNSTCYPYQGIRLNSLTASPQTYAGTVITAYGTGFTPSGNTVHFDGIAYSNVYSSNGTSLSFTVPYSALYSYNYGGSQTVPVYIVNGNGMTSNTIQFSLNNSGNGYGNPTITNVNGPTNVTAGTSNTYTVYLNNVYNQYVTVMANWGDSSGNTTSQQVYVNGSGSVSMTHTYYSSGTYTIQFSVSGNNGSYSNTYPYTVYVTGNNYGSPYISYLSPQQGSVGTTVAIQGNGFSTYGNTVHFASGGALNLQSYNNGSVIYYIIPHTVSGCDLITPGAICSQYVQQITPGTYSLYVTNQNGQSSNTQTFRVY